jgi:hypothetical protein
MHPNTEYILNKWKIRFEDYKRSPIEIPNIGRDDFPILFNELNLKRGVEIGVEEGLYSEVLCKLNPGCEHYSIDPWKAYRGYRMHVSQDKIDGFYQTAQKRLEPYNAKLVKKFSMDAVRDFKDESLDYVYIDGNHRIRCVIEDLEEWTRKVRVGGIIAGHDYVVHRPPTGMHVVEAVHAWTQAYHIHPWFIAGTRPKDQGFVRDKSRSFFWVNEPLPSPARNQQ